MTFQEAIQQHEQYPRIQRALDQGHQYFRDKYTGDAIELLEMCHRSKIKTWYVARNGREHGEMWDIMGLVYGTEPITETEALLLCLR